MSAFRVLGLLRATPAWRSRWCTTTAFLFSDSDLCVVEIKSRHVSSLLEESPTGYLKTEGRRSVRIDIRKSRMGGVLVHRRTSVCSSGAASHRHIVSFRHHLLGLSRWQKRQVGHSSCGRANR